MTHASSRALLLPITATTTSPSLSSSASASTTCPTAPSEITTQRWSGGEEGDDAEVEEGEKEEEGKGADRVKTKWEPDSGMEMRGRCVGVSEEVS